MLDRVAKMAARIIWVVLLVGLYSFVYSMIGDEELSPEQGGWILVLFLILFVIVPVILFIYFLVKFQDRLKNLMSNKMVLLSSVLLLFIAFLFFWFQIRPASAKSSCHDQIIETPGEVTAKTYDVLFKACLHSKGF
ncbi:MAG: hypothetical protein NUV73_01580 [Candidatus Daviesbacteria bacterium]|nr:hypothetical protein [Candidatus Daviesbacteria bacterium]